MSQSRFRQIARLEKLAQPHIQRKRQIEKEWEAMPHGAAAHAAVISFIIRFGDPKIGEPLSCAWERFINTDVWKECCDKSEAMELKQLADWKEKNGEETSPRNLSLSLNHSYRAAPYNRDGVILTGEYLRHELIARFPGATEKEKLEQVFASAPPWLIWFAFADYTAGLLGLPLPNLSSVTGFARSKVDFNNWYGVPSGAFVPRPWPNGPNNEPLARTDLNLLRPATERLSNPKTRREHRRAQAICMKTPSAKISEYWPYLFPLGILTMSWEQQDKLFSAWKHKQDS